MTPALVRTRDRFRILTSAAGLLAPLALLVIIVVLLQQAWLAMVHHGPGFLTSSIWDQVRLQFGALPYIFGTVVTAAIALILAVPVGIGVALFLAEPGQAGVRRVIGTGVELLAAIPSVVYGLWALFVMGPFVYKALELPINRRLGFLALFAGTPRPTSFVRAGLCMAVVVLPPMAAVSGVVRRPVRAAPTQRCGGSRSLSACGSNPRPSYISLASRRPWLW